MRMRRMDDILHEGAAIAAMLVPVVREDVARLQRSRKIVVIKGRKAVAQSMKTLKQQPMARRIVAIGSAHGIQPGGILRHRWIQHVLQISLNHTVIAARLKQLRTISKCVADILPRAVRGDADGMRMNVSVPLDITIQLACRGQRIHRRLDPGAAKESQQPLFVTREFCVIDLLAARSDELCGGFALNLLNVRALGRCGSPCRMHDGEEHDKDAKPSRLGSRPCLIHHREP